MHYNKSKFKYYFESLFNIFYWSIFSFNIKSKWCNLSKSQQDFLLERRDYYIKLEKIKSSDLNTSISSFKRDGGIFYYLDLKQYLASFPRHKKFNYCFGDITYVPKTPSFLKSRPIDGQNNNSVLLPLNSIRHFHFVNDRLSFFDKKDIIVWRGSAWQPQRQKFLTKYFNNPLCDVGSVRGLEDERLLKPFMSIKNQLEYKFILSLEGNDVATSLKWIMSSNSIAVMPEPKYETWFMEGKLIPDFHYIRIKDDYSDLEDRIKFYLANPDKCNSIISNANIFVSQFKNLQLERLLTMMVIDKYFSLVE